MGDMQLLEMRDALRYSIFNRADLTNPQLNRWINWGYTHLCQPRVFRHRELQIDTGNLVTLVTGQIQYDITAATLGMSVPFLYEVVYVAGPDSGNLNTRRRKLRGGQDVREFAMNNLAQGEPTHYALYGTDLWVNLRPATTQNGHVVVIRGWREPAPLTSDDQHTVIRGLFDEVILLGARWRAYRELGRYDLAEIAKADFVGMLGDMQEPWSSDAEDWGGYFQPDADQYERGTP
jgi:hypothetical protein